MRFPAALTVFLASSSGVTSFAPKRPRCTSTTLCSTVDARPLVAEQKIEAAPEDSPLFGEEINIRLEDQMEKLRTRDKKSRALTREELNVVYEDDHLVVVNKPSGVLSVPTREVSSALSESVFETFGCDMGRADMMVVHRLAMDSSGIMVLVKTMDALRGMNEAFRTRQVVRKYEVMVCGHMTKDAGVIDVPVMRDYERPPFMRISTDDHQRKLIDLESNIVGRKILEAPKESITKYQVISREELDGQPVTRVALTSVSGRTHQLNVHMAAIGHPIVGDKIYGFGGDALPNGGRTEEEMNELAPNRPTEDILKNIAVQGKPTCVHAKFMSFYHPVTYEKVTFECDAPF